MTKKKSSKHQEEQLEHQEEQLEHQEEQLEPEPMTLASFALTMAVEARVFSLLTPLFPLLERMETGEKITEKEILDKLSSVKVGKKTALEKLIYLRKQHMILELPPNMLIDPPFK